MEIKNISKSYGKKTVLKDISFSADEGVCIGIVGGNGSGKSTLLNILSGVTRCDGGCFEYDGVNLFGNRKRCAEIIGYVPQSTPLIEELSALDNLRLWYTGEEIKRELSGGVLEKLGIGEFLKVTVSKLSGGMKKRLAIGCAVAHSPKILLLDEPSAALDVVCKQTIREYIRDFKAKGGIVIIATHDTDELPLCDRIYLLKGGSLCEYRYDGSVERLIAELKK